MNHQLQSERQTKELDQSVPLSVAIVTAVAETTGTDPIGLQAPADVIDPDALERMVQSNDSCRVTFEYELRGNSVR